MRNFLSGIGAAISQFVYIRWSLIGLRRKISNLEYHLVFRLKLNVTKIIVISQSTAKSQLCPKDIICWAALICVPEVGNGVAAQVVRDGLAAESDEQPPRKSGRCRGRSWPKPATLSPGRCQRVSRAVASPYQGRRWANRSCWSPARRPSHSQMQLKPRQIS